MNKKNKSIIIGLVVLILLFIGGIIGKRINDENAVIKKAEVAINNGDYDNARDILYTVVDGNNKKIEVSKELIELLKEGVELTKQTKGHFNIFMGNIIDYYKNTLCY